jgi:hypothetical protein
MKMIGRRAVLRGAGGIALTLPLLEGLLPRKMARAGGDAVEPFAIFFRQACGVGCAQSTGEIGDEPERFWPTDYGALSAATMLPGERAVGELVDYADRLLLVHNVNMYDFDYGDGHARGCMQGLTAQGPTVQGAAGASEAAGESIDHRIGRELNAEGRDSLVMYAGQSGGWLGGACTSYRGSATRRAALHNPVTAYQTMMGVDSDQFDTLVARQASVNDLVRDEMNSLLGSTRLSSADRERLELHLQSIRDLEEGLMCNLEEAEEAALEGESAGYDGTDGVAVLNAARVHMDIAALAVACGYTRAASIQIGSGNDGSTRYQNLDTGDLMENYHYVSHRRASHDSSGTVIPNSDLLHHFVDVQFARTFKHLLDRLDAYLMPNGQKLLDAGLAIWWNDNGNGPGHSSRNVPFVIGGSASGFLKQGEYLRADGDNGQTNHSRMLNTIGSAVGLRNDAGEYLDDFGDTSVVPTGLLPAIMA